MKKLSLLACLLLVLASVPAVNADHLSVGAEDAALVAAREDDGNRSVAGTQDWSEATGDESNKPYAIGTTPAGECHDPSSEVSPEEANDTLAAHGFCNMLVYHDNASTEANTSNLTHLSKPDQHYPTDSPVDRFDVVRAHLYTFGISTCYPFCPPREGQAAGGQAMFNITHEFTHAVGLTDDPRTANNKESSERSQSYGVTLSSRGYGGLVQDTTDIWEMDGWWAPTAFTSFVAYISDEDGNPVGKDRLIEIVGNETTTGTHEDALHEGTEPTVCGYTPDFVFTTVTPGAAGLNCEFEFEAVHPGEDDDRKFDGYDDECESPAYFCGEVNGPAWYSGCTCVGLADPETPGFDNVPNAGFAVYEDGSTFGGPEGQTDYIRWHFVVAPHNSQCGGAQEPGFSFNPGPGNTLPYLAHDLDVYTTAASVDGAGGSVPEVFDYSDAIAEEQTAQIGPTVTDGRQNIDETISNLPGVPSDVTEARSNVQKSDQLEPNDDTGGLSVEDTSRSWENGKLLGGSSLEDTGLYRDLSGKCDPLFAVENDPANADPWVDYIDSEATALHDAQAQLTYRSDEIIDVRTDLYGNAGENQDDDNRPGPSLYSTQGNVGFFADTDNDGEYDPNEAGVKYNPGNIQERGAYPMEWNMWVKENDNGQPVVDTDEGCTMGAGGDTTMPEQMQQLGYTANTSLVQALYLKEATAFQTDAADTQDPVPAITYPSGNNIYLMMSQSARQLWEGRDQIDPAATDDNPVDNEIDSLLENLETYADSVSSGLDLSQDVHVPGAELGIEAAFTDQCNGNTGNFDNDLQFLHHCTDALDCSGDTIVTMYTFELQDDGSGTATLSGAPVLPDFAPGDDNFEFDATYQHTWYDVDAFDNNPNRNRDSGPPDQKETDPGYLGEGLFN